MDYFLIILAMLCYFLASVQCWYRSVNVNAKVTFGCVAALCAILLHGFILYDYIDYDSGQNLTVRNLLSQSIWVTACISWCLSWSRWFSPLSLAVYMLAAVSSFVLLIPIVGQDPQPVVYSNAIIIHVISSLTVVSLYLLSGLQAMLIVLQHHMMKNNAKSWLHYEWPSIERMETYLFQMIAMAFVLLSGLIGFSVVYMPKVIWQQAQTKLVFVFVAWLASLMLLVGRYFWGWRGSVAVKWTWFGLILVLSAFLLASLK